MNKRKHRQGRVMTVDHPRKPRVMADAAKVSQWKKAYQRGATVAEIAAAHQMGAQTVALVLRRLGVTSGKRGRPPGRPGKKKPAEQSKHAHRLPEWRKLYRAGQSINQIARQYDLHPYSVQFLLRKAGVKLRGTKHKLITASMVREWIRLYQTGWGSTNIARKYGVNQTTVRRHLKRAGVRLRSNGCASAGTNPPERSHDATR